MAVNRNRIVLWFLQPSAICYFGSTPYLTQIYCLLQPELVKKYGITPKGHSNNIIFGTYIINSNKNSV